MSLIKEFAIEPRVMATWEHFNSLWEDFGAEQGRLISKYPLLWKQKVDELTKVHSKPIRAAAISAKIRRDDYKFLVTGRAYNGSTDWLSNARSHMSRQPFHAIIASEKSDEDQETLVAGDFPKDEPPYRVVKEDFILRRAPDLARCASLLLENCDEIQFIDPHFDPSEPRFTNTFEAMLQLCKTRVPRRVEVHRIKPTPFKRDVQRANYERQLALLVPDGATVRVFFWTQMPGGLGLHPRFLLTDLGGFHFENGLDEGEAGEMTLVKPLTQKVWQECRTSYCDSSTCFQITPDCIVSIRGRG